MFIYVIFYMLHNAIAVWTGKIQENVEKMYNLLILDSFNGHLARTLQTVLQYHVKCKKWWCKTRGSLYLILLQPLQTGLGLYWQTG